MANTLRRNLFQCSSLAKLVTYMAIGDCCNYRTLQTFLTGWRRGNGNQAPGTQPVVSSGWAATNTARPWLPRLELRHRPRYVPYYINHPVAALDLDVEHLQGSNAAHDEVLLHLDIGAGE